MIRTAPRRQRGMTLVQLLVGAGLSLLLSAALSTFFIGSSRSTRGDMAVAAMLDELGFATAVLAADLEMAGFWAQVHDPALVGTDASLALGGPDCGNGNWYRRLDALQVLDRPTPALAAATFPCLSADEVVAGADIVAVKRVVGRVTATPAAGTIYLRSHDRTGLLFLAGGALPAVPAPHEDRAYAPAVYFVRRYTSRADEVPRVPALCRKVLVAAGAVPQFQTECVAQGVENLQIEVGIDSDEDGGANYFSNAPNAAELARASTARIYVQIRSAQHDPNYVNAKTYQIGNAPPYTPSGDERHHYRKTLSADVALHNLRGLQGVAVQ